MSKNLYEILRIHLVVHIVLNVFDFYLMFHLVVSPYLDKNLQLSTDQLKA